MKKTLLAPLLAISLLGLFTTRSAAYWNSPQCCSGFGWLKCMALNSCPKMYFEGPLYNYGPNYSGYGYETYFVNNPYCGAYMPAYPSIYYDLPGNLRTQWHDINPGVPNYPFVPVYPYGPPQSPADYLQSAARYAPAAPIPPVPTAAPPSSTHQIPSAETAVEQSPGSPTDGNPAKTTSFSRFRSRFQR